MTKQCFLLAMGCMALVGCSENEYLNGDALDSSKNQDIQFITNNPTITRGLTGADAASKLGNHFVVYGTKHTQAENGSAAHDDAAFENYTVEYEAGTANTTLSNTANWEYVDKTSYDATLTKQSLKYWDYSAAGGYTFHAFSSRDISYPAEATDKISVTKITNNTSIYTKGYEVTIKNGADFTNLYFADRKPVTKTDFGQPVQFNFRSFGAKVRVGFYETIPGYKVTITDFHYHPTALEPVTSFDNMSANNTTNFSAGLTNVSTTAESSKFIVAYHDATSGVENQPAITNVNVDYNYSLTLGGNLLGKTLGTTTATATYDRSDASYTDVYPYEANSNAMLLCLDYTIESEEDQSEKLTVLRAKAVVPLQYVQWKSNCCYTYLFKISESTNGTTGYSGDTEGLYPVKFDAISISTDDNDQTNLISVDRFSIATFLDGDDTYIVTTDPTTGEVYIPTAGIGDEANQVQMYYVTTTGDEISEESIYLRLTGTRNGLLLTPVMNATNSGYAAELAYQVPATDGTYYTFGTQAQPGALKYKSETGYCYAYVYCKTQHVDAVYVKATAYESGTQYYTEDDDVYTAVTIGDENAFNTMKASTDLYKRITEPVTGDYAVLRLDTRTTNY